MSTITLYDCPRLRARISLASCKANRDKPDDPVMLDKNVNYAVRPSACRGCTDWKAWGNATAVTTDNEEGAKERCVFVCAGCGEKKPHYGKGLCARCYQRQRLAKVKAQAAETPEAGAPGAPSAPEHTSFPVADPALAARRIYLACPYTAPEAAVMDQRREAASLAANALARQGYTVFSPISHGAEIGQGLPPDFAFWSTSCLSFVELWATDVFVLMLPGWEASTGVAAEVGAATARHIPVTHILPTDGIWRK